MRCATAEAFMVKCVYIDLKVQCTWTKQFVLLLFFFFSALALFISCPSHRFMNHRKTSPVPFSIRAIKIYCATHTCLTFARRTFEIYELEESLDAVASIRWWTKIKKRLVTYLFTKNSICVFNFNVGAFFFLLLLLVDSVFFSFFFCLNISSCFASIIACWLHAK